MGRPPINAADYEWIPIEQRREIYTAHHMDPTTGELRQYTRRNPVPKIRVEIDDGETWTKYALIKKITDGKSPKKPASPARRKATQRRGKRSSRATR